MPHRLNAFLGSSPELRQLSSTARQLMALQRMYASIAPPSLQHNSRILQLRHQLLSISADNGAVAAKLRQMAPELISLFQARGCEVTGIQIRVQVTAAPRAAPPKARKLGRTAQEALDRLNATLADSPLKTALKRLSKRT
ncbi:Zn-ribbon-containing, possibly RNA-binding protein and truncated derivatives [Sideroxyarcus emersonii]|uniref:Zn-ribbon-containing, possibly RNA-binding protein and truncated derivatives n=1 Tax=Sideroxyarcus emersonii TaxID=2764705 RepID=A0AAN2C016_9PROT|nr:DciA family protein [Sideroxyarcus emersonii]BCK88673.1 Zn-ribbon-containing, possibly RNA-binding protein and truncated derivatives [Sideroxyarcus emersonii]